MDFLKGLTCGKLTKHVPCYSKEDSSEEEKTKEIIELGEYLRKKREEQEKKDLPF
jgi:hypothetical protein